jgi:hypothetical protein
MGRSKWLRPLLGLCIVALVLPLAFTPADARVSRIEILERIPFAPANPGDAVGIAFGNVGPYERIKGRLYYTVDPDNRYNQQIVDLQLAKTGQLFQDVSELSPNGFIEKVGPSAVNAKGEVEYWGDFMLIKPVDVSKGNHRLLYDVNNRGNLRMLEYYNNAPSGNDPKTIADAGNGWLMREGYSLLWTGWNWDVEGAMSGVQPQRIFLPIIRTPDNKDLVAWINAEITIQVKDGILFDWLAWGGSRCYAAAEDSGLRQQAVLSVRDLPDVDHIGPRTTIDRSAWDFAKVVNNAVVPSAVQVYYPNGGNGFEKGRIYEVLYWAKNPRVVGLGLAGIRDAISFFRFETQDDVGTKNPLAVAKGKKEEKVEADPEYAYIFGISQSGRVITTMIYQGFHVDEKGRMAFEGARPDVPGGGKGSFNYRWAQTTHHPKHIEGNYFAADHFPFNFTRNGRHQLDPYQPGALGDVLAVAKRLGQRVPKIMLTNHETEYWTRAASLVHTDVLGTQDALDLTHPDVRFYAVNGSQHGSPSTTSRRTNASDQHSDGYVEHRPVGRALLVALDNWVTKGIEPPPTKVPLVAKGEMLTATEHKARFPQIPSYSINGVNFPATRHPGTYLKPPRADYGPDFFMPDPSRGGQVPVAYPGLQTNVPPTYFGPPFETRVPAFDSDGNGIGGIRMPELTVPLGTYQGWNPRCDACGASNFLQPFNVSFWPFARTEAERGADPRPSIEARYANKADYVARVRAAVQQLREQGFMLAEDEAAPIQFAEKLVWPPFPTNGYPFWQLEQP